MCVYVCVSVCISMSVNEGDRRESDCGASHVYICAYTRVCVYVCVYVCMYLFK